MTSGAAVRGDQKQVVHAEMLPFWCFFARRTDTFCFSALMLDERQHPPVKVE